MNRRGFLQGASAAGAVS
ncbi:MAG: twin-arginine translocation signal domain-containing protein, partial [Steroidobacteraceae bacterium]